MASADGDPRTPRALGLDARLEAAGFNVAGVLDIAGYDSHVPTVWNSSNLLPAARSALVLACGGRAFGAALNAAHSLPADDPIDGLTARVVGAAANSLGGSTRTLFYWEQRGGAFADFVALGRACGIGAPSRLGLLLHPVYGPWLSIRAVLLTALVLPPTPPLPDFEPCTGCSAPCAKACPGDALAGASFDGQACARTTLGHAPCRARCDARHACVVGREHSISPELERRHREAVVSLLDADGIV